MISVIIPCYNQQEYLPDAIESILSQTKAPHEIICVIDGATDHSLDIAKSYIPHGIRVISQVNKGLASARNTGIMNATGDYILPLDSDDMLLENAIEVLEKVIAYNQPDVIAPSFKTFGVHNNSVILKGIPTLDSFRTENRLGYFSCIKRSVLLSIGGYNPKMTWGYEDYDCWIDIFKRGHSLCVLEDVLVLYRTKPDSMYTRALDHDGELRDQIRRNHPELWRSA